MKYDITLRTLLADGAPALIRMIGDAEMDVALQTEFPETRDSRVDTLVRLTDGRILHLEWRSDFDPQMPWRMLWYRVLIHRRHPDHPVHQAVVQIGGERPIAGSLTLEGLSYQYKVLDSRDLDPAPLLASPSLADNILAILFGRYELGSSIRAILHRLATVEMSLRRDALSRMLIFAGLRRVIPLVMEECSPCRFTSTSPRTPTSPTSSRTRFHVPRQKARPPR